MRLIDADALIREECGNCDGFCDICGDGERCLKCTSHCQCQLRDAINDAETVDAEPVRRGEWGETQIIGYDGIHPVYGKPCSECGYMTELYKPNYCPNCGMKADGGKQDA